MIDRIASNIDIAAEQLRVSRLEHRIHAHPSPMGTAVVSRAKVVEAAFGVPLLARVLVGRLRARVALAVGEIAVGFHELSADVHPRRDRAEMVRGKKPRRAAARLDQLTPEPLDGQLPPLPGDLLPDLANDPCISLGRWR